MNTFLIIAVAVGIPVYALLWHNQPARTQKEESSRLARELLWPRRNPRLHKLSPPRKAVTAARSNGNEQWLSNTTNILRLWDRKSETSK